MKILSNLLVLFFLLNTSLNAQQNSTEFPKLSGPYLGQTVPGITSEQGVWNFNQQKVWEIDKAGNEDFGRPGEPRIGNNGILYLRDFEKKYSYIFDAEGALLKKFAYQGEDKDVSMYINCFTFGENVVIGAMDKLHFYTSDGELIKSVPNNIFMRFPQAFMNVSEYLVAPGALTGLPEGIAEITKVNLESGKDEKFAEIILSEEEKALPPGGVIVGLIPQILTTYDDKNERIYFCKNSEYKIFVVDLDGKILNSFGREAERINVSLDARKEHLSFFLEDMPDETITSMAKGLPGKLVYFHNIQINNGFLYIFRMTEFSTKLTKQVIDIYSLEGEFLYTGTIQFENGLSLKGVNGVQIRGNSLYALLSDEEGKSKIVKYIIDIPSSSQYNQDLKIKQKISRIENRLIELKSIDNPFRPDSSQLGDLKSLTERMEYYKIPGVSIAVINNNQLEWAKAYGIMDVNTGAPVTTETIFEAGSTSKLLTAVLVLHFIQMDIIDLDINVNNYLKSWKVPENEFTVKEKVTLRRLLTHQAGLPDTNYDSDESVEYPTLIDVLNGKHGLNKAAIPENIPGSKWQYSNIGYNVIQLLLEDILGKPFQQIAEEIIFKPLGMNNSTFVYPLDAERKKREAMPHDIEGISRETLMHLTALAHGGLTTTPTDLSKFTIELMLSYNGKSEKIISQEMTKRLFTKECEIDQEKFPVPWSEGLGVFLMGEDRDFLFTHPGMNNPGFACWLIGWPEHGTATVIMINGKGPFGFGLISLEVISAIINEYNK